MSTHGVFRSPATALSVSCVVCRSIGGGGSQVLTQVPPCGVPDNLCVKEASVCIVCLGGSVCESVAAAMAQ